MAWDDTRSTVLAACDTCLEQHGYKLVKSRDAFEKSSASERRGVYIMLVASKHGNFKLRVWCGVRNNAIEERFHKTSGVDKKYRANYTTINLDCGEYWDLNSEKEIARAIGNAKRFITDTAIPFLEREYSAQDFSELLNTNPVGICPYHGNAENRCHYGLIAAKLAADPAYEDLKAAYAEYMRSTNKGFYFPRFEKLVEDLES
jgi:hypothetical protein